MDKIIIKKVELNCPVQQAFKLFTENKHLEKWLTIKADVETKVNGKYELFWNPEDRKNNSTIGCKILAFDEPNYLNFEWKGPMQFKHFMNNIRPLTNVTIIFKSINNKTHITLLHTGWRDTEYWEQARQYFNTALRMAFEQLIEYVNE